MTARLTAVEIDEGLAAPLAERMAGGNVDVVLGDATALDFDDDRFTGAASFHMLHHIAPASAQDRVFAELARVLVPGRRAGRGRRRRTAREPAAFHEGDTYNPIEPDDLAAAPRPAPDSRTWTVRTLRPRVGLHGPLPRLSELRPALRPQMPRPQRGIEQRSSARCRSSVRAPGRVLPTR